MTVYVRVDIYLEPNHGSRFIELVPKLAESLKPYGWTLVGCYSRIIGPDNHYTHMNLWHVPDVSAYENLPSQISKNPELGRIYKDVRECILEEKIHLSDRHGS
ncbi:hypothetical protein [Sorangium sp. So ce406]|uniref:hypothetical protein n=1 Tax=Sorangium sp. So ce406 TaxID=3133311 RepID=UPI003F5C6A59